MLGLPDKDYGEAVSAIIVAEAEAKKRKEQESRLAISLEELCSWARDKLAPYKVYYYYLTMLFVFISFTLLWHLFM